MDEMIKTLFDVGLPADEVHRVMEYYREDLNGLRHYVAYMRALFDDRHEFVD